MSSQSVCLDIKYEVNTIFSFLKFRSLECGSRRFQTTMRVHSTRFCSFLWLEILTFFSSRKKLSSNSYTFTKIRTVQTISTSNNFCCGLSRNTKYLLKHKIAVKREAAVTKEMNAKLAEDKKISRKEKDERILWKKNEVAEYESTTFR